LLNLILDNASCLIWKLFRLLVSLMDMTRKLYLANSIQTYEGSICIGVV
jgi:hypothetical protein